jgi:arsenite methyltransferase
MSTSPDDLRSQVRETYATVATTSGACGPGCCSVGAEGSLAMGYTAEDLAAVPEGANMGLGCGNPQAIAALRPGERVLDLGSGGGFDAFLAARQVGEEGHVIGVDMTPAMVAKARANAKTLGLAHVEFRLGEIEHLPVEDGTVDVILSNCVINLSPDKPRVVREAFRVLAPGGRLAISDVVAIGELPETLRTTAAHVTCVAGATPIGELRAMLEAAGFQDVRVNVRPESAAFIAQWLPGSGAEAHVASASIEAVRPGTPRTAKARVRLGVAPPCDPGSGCC